MKDGVLFLFLGIKPIMVADRSVLRFMETFKEIFEPSLVQNIR